MMIGGLMLLFSCNDSRSLSLSEMDSLSTLLDETPDSVYTCLQAITHAEKLPEEAYYAYVLLQIRAKAKCDMDISADTAIFAANDYFVAHGDADHASWTSFYCGRILQKEQKYDKALSYLLSAEQLAESINDNRLKGIIQFNIGAILAEKPDRKEESLEHFSKSSDYFLLAGSTRSHALEVENERLHTHRVWLLLYAIGAVCMIGMLLFLFYRRSCLNKQRALKAQHTIQELQQLARSFDEKEDTFRATLLRHFNILRKAASLEIYISKESNKHDHHLLKVINEIVYGQETLNWDLLYETMNQLHDGFFDRLRDRFPQLDESEFKICCLSYTRFSSSEIALVMKLSVNTVQMKRSSIRKKIGVETFGNLSDFFNENMK